MRDRTPVLVGTAQLLQRAESPAEAKPPLELMLEAVRVAALDSGAPELIRSTSSIRVIRGIWGYRNPGLALAERLGLRGDGNRVETGLSVLGGNHVQQVLNRSALDIQQGQRDIVILVGAECGRTLGQAQKAGSKVEWLRERDDDPAPKPDVEYGNARWTRHEAEMARGLERPVQYYSLFENALRHHRGESVDQHLDRISKLWAGFSNVARGNPHAWIRREVTAHEIRTLSSSNRPISFPYPKLMNANLRVDMGAALILCSLGTATSFGVPADKAVFPWSGTDASDHYYVSERDNLYSSPAIRIAGKRALELAATDLDSLDFIDLYSCFPSAVQVAANELGLSLERPLTVTGGLTFGGGPLNNYVMHSIARTVELLRESDSGKALVTANGGMLTKHSFGVYGKRRPERGFRHQSLQAEVDRTPGREVLKNFAGSAEIESYAVMFGQSQGPASTSYTSIYGKAAAAGSEPSVAHLACRLADGRRTWANLFEPEVLESMCHEEHCGRTVRIDGQGTATLCA